VLAIGLCTFNTKADICLVFVLIKVRTVSNSPSSWMSHYKASRCPWHFLRFYLHRDCICMLIWVPLHPIYMLFLISFISIHFSHIITLIPLFSILSHKVAPNSASIPQSVLQNAASFSFHYFLVSLTPSSSCLRLFPLVVSKDKFVPVYATQAYRGSRDTAPLLLNLANRWVE
jgi:hypothetical protein